MKARTWRRVHRYLGLVIGIQLLLWAVSGTIFSWNSIKAVRGEDRIRTPEPLDLRNFQIADVNVIVSRVTADGEFRDHVPVSIVLGTMLDRPVFEMTLARNHARKVVLVDAVTGETISAIGQETARKIALADFSEPAQVTEANLLETTGSHSEYRGKELPAWRVELDDPDATVIYVAANRGSVTARRNNRWRMFDFFWMLHTMDYQGRDNFNHWLLKSVSLFGVVTVLSGFVLWFKTSRFFRGRKRRVTD